MKSSFLIAFGIMGILVIVMAVAIIHLSLRKPDPPRSVIIHQKGTTDTQGIGIHLRDKHGSGADLNFGHEERR